MRVRRATRADLQACVRMALRFVTDTAYRGKVTANVGQLQALVEFLLDFGAVFVAVLDDATVVGMIGASVINHPISGELTGSEVAWWVDPEYRGGIASVRLLVELEKWSVREAGAVRFQMIAPAGDERIRDLYRRRGYYEVETVFQRDLVVGA